jgi:hypothetical protein
MSIYRVLAWFVQGRTMMTPCKLLVQVAALAALVQSAVAQTPARNDCLITRHVTGYPANGPRGNNDWYANADRTIWATFWGWDFVRGPDEADPKTGYEPGQKVL